MIFLAKRVYLFLLLIFFLFVQNSLIAAPELDNDNGKIPQLILPKNFHKQKNPDIKNWLMSEKLDGVRAYWDGQALFSRSGKRFAVPEWFIKDFPKFELDGELWTKRGDFEGVISIVNRQQPHNGWRKISYQIFEVPNAKGNFQQRLNKIKNYLKTYPSTSIKVIPQQICNSEEHLQLFLSEIEHLGGEGVVVRNAGLNYHTGRSFTSLKVKSAQDAECRITGYKKGKGKFKGLTGALLCQMDDRRIIAIGSGLSDKERENPPAIGTIITYKYNGFTSSGKPRFPVFLRIRKTF